jgi:hypothetical protein
MNGYRSKAVFALISAAAASEENISYLELAAMRA